MLKPAPWWVSAPVLPDSMVPCTQCGRVMETERMMKLEVTRAGEGTEIRWLCPPHAGAFSRAWLEVGLAVLR
jgi:hypothetical protein